MEAPREMLVAMGLAAAISMFNGCLPWVFLYRVLPFEVQYVPYTSAHVISQLQLLFFSALAFTWLKLSGIYPPELRSVNLDWDWTYRKMLPGLAGGLARVGGRVKFAVRRWLVQRRETLLSRVYRYHGPEGVFARTWALGSAVLWVLVLLFLVLAVYYY